MVDPSLGSPAPVWPWNEGIPEATREDRVAVEEPLEIRHRDRVFAVIMRSPGHDRELTLGLLLAEGIVRSAQEVTAITPCLDVPREARGNVVRFDLDPAVKFSLEDFRRNLLTSSACGVCGKESIEDLLQRFSPIPSSHLVPAETIQELPRTLRKHQRTFDNTGGVHGAALFDGKGRLLIAREDVGRHNAVDKVVGAAWKAGPPEFSQTILMVSGRISFEIVQKAMAAGISIVAGVSAPTSLAVELAEAARLTLIGFLRDRRFNVYSQPQRVVRQKDPPTPA